MARGFEDLSFMIDAIIESGRDHRWIVVQDQRLGDVPSRRRALEVPVASFSGPLASSLAVRSVRHPPRRSCSGIEILPSVNLVVRFTNNVAVTLDLALGSGSC